MAHHRQSFPVGEMAIPLMETPEQQRIMDLEEQLEQEKESHKETKSKLEFNKSQLEIAEIKRASEVEGLRSAIQCLVLHNQTSTKNNLESENDSKIQKLESELEKVNKKFDTLKESILKGQMQEELQTLKDLNEKSVSENARLQEELADSITETKGLKECIKELEKTNFKKDEKIQELEETIRQKDCKLDELENKPSDVVDELEKKDIEYEELKKKYEETIVKLKVSAMNCLELRNSQQQQHQQLQQLSEYPSMYYDSLCSKELKECLSNQKKALDAWFNKENKMYWKCYDTYARCYKILSDENKNICDKMWGKYSDVLRGKRR